MRILNALFALLFVLGALVQVNDPDPLPWIAIYAAAALGCAGWELRRAARPFLLPIAVVSLVWAIAVALRTELAVPLGVALMDWGMHSGGSEEAREAGGLLLIALWTAALALRPRPQSVKTNPETSAPGTLAPPVERKP